MKLKVIYTKIMEKVKVTIEISITKDLSKTDIEKRMQDMIANVEWEDIPKMEVVKVTSKVREYTITKADFLEWYFEDGEYTEENETLKRELADKAIKGLIETGTSTITVEDVFKEANTDAIRLSYLSQFATTEENYDIEFGELAGNNTLTLID